MERPQTPGIPPTRPTTRPAQARPDATQRSVQDAVDAKLAARRPRTDGVPTNHPTEGTRPARPTINPDTGQGARPATGQRPVTSRPAQTRPEGGQRRPAQAPATGQGSGRSNYTPDEITARRAEAIREKKKMSRPAVSDRWLDTHEDQEPQYGIGAERKPMPKKKRQYHQARLELRPRDFALMLFLARYRFASRAQLERHFGVKDLSRRLTQLKKAGFLYNESITKTQSLWTPTLAGMDLADVDYNVLSGGKINPSTIGHTLGLVNIGSDLETGKLDSSWLPDELDQDARGEVVITEREITQSFNTMKPILTPPVMRSTYLDEWGMDHWTYMLHGPGGKTHKPDMVVARGGHGRDLALELELSPKRTNEWKQILTMYKNSPYGYLIYYTHKRSIAASLMKINEHEVGLENFQVRTYKATHTNIPFWG